MYMTVFVIDKIELLEDVLSALAKGGIRGATILESSGLHRHQQKRLPLRYLYTSQDADETENVTVFAVVEDMQGVENCLAIVESVVGDMDSPNTGIFAAWELDRVKGIPRTPGQGL